MERDTLYEQEELASSNGETASIVRIPKKRNLTVEPMLCLSVIGLGALTVTLQSFVVNSICLDRNKKLYASDRINCDNLTAYKDEGKVNRFIQYCTSCNWNLRES